MIPAELSAAVAAAARTIVPDGTPVPPGTGYAGVALEWLGTKRTDGHSDERADYATPVALRLAAATGQSAMPVAGLLADRLAGLPEIAAARAVPPGFCHLTLDRAARGAIAGQIVEAGARYAGSHALSDRAVTAARAGNLARTADLDQARGWLAEEVTGTLTEACGGRVTWTGPRITDAPVAAGSPVTALLTAAGVGATRYALLRSAPGGEPDPADWARAHLDNPAYAVRYAHAHAAGTTRQAADLGMAPGDRAAMRGELLAEPADVLLLGLVAELPGRVVAAAQRHEPAVLGRYLEEVADAYFSWRETVDVLPRGDAEPAAVHIARLWLAAAARTVLGAGLGLLGVPAPARM